VAYAEIEHAAAAGKLLRRKEIFQSSYSKALPMCYDRQTLKAAFYLDFVANRLNVALILHRSKLLHNIPRNDSILNPSL
jgi:hypothetical protein